MCYSVLATLRGQKMHTFEETAESYIRTGGEERYLPPIIEYFRGRDIASIAPFDIREMAEKFYPDRTGATKNRQAITPARAVMMHGYERGWCPYLRVRRFKLEERKRKKPASTAWMLFFLRQCELDNLHHLGAIVLFMQQTGARISEAVRLSWEEVDLQKRKVVLLKTKTSSNSVRYLTEELVARMEKLERYSELPVFYYTSRYSVNERIKAVCERAQIPYKSPHLVGRHSFATNAIKAGIDVKTAMEAGGWKSASIFLETYVHNENAGQATSAAFGGLRFDITPE